MIHRRTPSVQVRCSCHFAPQQHRLRNSSTMSQRLAVTAPAGKKKRALADTCSENMHQLKQLTSASGTVGTQDRWQLNSTASSASKRDGQRPDCARQRLTDHFAAAVQPSPRSTSSSVAAAPVVPHLGASRWWLESSCPARLMCIVVAATAALIIHGLAPLARE
jgi:hypothetical protein